VLNAEFTHKAGGSTPFPRMFGAGYIADLHRITG